MGAKQSRGKEKTKEEMLSREEVIRLLMAQRAQVYEELCNEFVDIARSGSAGNSTTVATSPASPSSVQIPVTPSQPTLETVKPAGHSSHCWTLDAGLETQHAPYRHVGDNSQDKITHSAQTSPINLYPNLETVTTNPLKNQELTIINDNTLTERVEPTTPVLPRLDRDVPTVPSRRPRPSAPPPPQTGNCRADSRVEPTTPGLPKLCKDIPNSRAVPTTPVLPRVNRDVHSSRPLSSAPVPPQSLLNWRDDNRSPNNKELCCSTCKSTWGPRIYKCDSGHISCETCKMGPKICGICSAYIRHPANLQRERYLAMKKVPCPHWSDGCTLFIKSAEVDIHVKECTFKGVQCPLLCRWEGKLEKLCDHFDAVHPEHRTADVDTEIQVRNISKNSQNLFLVLMRPYNFLFHVKVQNRTIYMTAQLIGTKMSADKWSYEVNVYNKNDSCRLYRFEDVCSSHVIPVADIFSEGRCLILPQAYASTFVLNGGLTYKFFIKKTVR